MDKGGLLTDPPPSFRPFQLEPTGNTDRRQLRHHPSDSIPGVSQEASATHRPEPTCNHSQSRLQLPKALPVFLIERFFSWWLRAFVQYLLRITLWSPHFNVSVTYYVLP